MSPGEINIPNPQGDSMGASLSSLLDVLEQWSKFKHKKELHINLSNVLFVHPFLILPVCALFFNEKEKGKKIIFQLPKKIEYYPAGADLQSAPHKPWIYNPLKPAVKIHTLFGLINTPTFINALPRPFLKCCRISPGAFSLFAQSPLPVPACPENREESGGYCFRPFGAFKIVYSILDISQI